MRNSSGVFRYARTNLPKQRFALGRFVPVGLPPREPNMWAPHLTNLLPRKWEDWEAREPRGVDGALLICAAV